MVREVTAQLQQLYLFEQIIAGSGYISAIKRDFCSSCGAEKCNSCKSVAGGKLGFNANSDKLFFYAKTIHKGGIEKLPIKCNAGSVNPKAYLYLASIHRGAGDDTYSELGFIRLGYDGNHVTKSVVKTDGTYVAIAFGPSEDGFVQVKSELLSPFYIRIIG